MGNKLQKAWDEYQKNAPLTTDSIRDRFNFQHGFNAAFRLFGKSNITNQSSRRGESWACPSCGGVHDDIDEYYRFCHFCGSPRSLF